MSHRMFTVTLPRGPVLRRTLPPKFEAHSTIDVICRVSDNANTLHQNLLVSWTRESIAQPGKTLCKHAGQATQSAVYRLCHSTPSAATETTARDQ